MPKTNYLILLLFLIITTHARNLYAQNNWSEQGFFNYLLERKLYDDAQTLIYDHLKTQDQTLQSNFYFQLGLIHYYQNTRDSALFYLERLDDHPLFNYQNLFLQSYLRAKKGDFVRSKKILEGQSDQLLHSPLQRLNYTFLLGNTLLQHDTKAYLALLKNDSLYFSIHHQTRKSYHIIYRELVSFSPKSELISASLSAVIPGLGKVYAGKSGEGISAFVKCAVLCSQALEAYLRNSNLKSNIRFWVFTPAFAIFYVGNIWGSVFTVRNRKRLFYAQKHQQILDIMYHHLHDYYQMD